MPRFGLVVAVDPTAMVKHGVNVSNTNSVHVPVLASEVLDALQIRPGMTVVDGTFGGGGHSRLMLDRIGPCGRLFAFDRDPGAIENFGPTISSVAAQVDLINDSYHRLPAILKEAGVTAVDAILLDLGLSSDQLDDENRGFSYQTCGALDLRFDPSEGETAAELLLRLPEDQIANIIYQFGEERCSRRIARRIVERRKRREAVQSAKELADLVRSCVPRSKNHSIDPATRTFQALRIAVNQELRIVQQAMEDLPGCLAPGGRIAVISFHSLEDRIVKHTMRSHPLLQVLTKKPILASDVEIAANPRSRSAKMRVAARLENANECENASDPRAAGVR